MISNEDDINWTLTGSHEFATQDELYRHLEVADHLKATIYRPLLLKQRGEEIKTQLHNKRFERVNFSKTEISGISFRDCSFEHCLFISSQIENCEFHGCKFILTNTHKVKISNTYIDPLTLLPVFSLFQASEYWSSSLSSATSK